MMNGFPSRAVAESLRRQYPAGTRVALVSKGKGKKGAAATEDESK